MINRQTMAVRSVGGGQVECLPRCSLPSLTLRQLSWQAEEAEARLSSPCSSGHCGRSSSIQGEIKRPWAALPSCRRSHRVR